MSDYGLPTPCDCCAPSCPVPTSDGQKQSHDLDQCGYDPGTGNLWTGQLYHSYSATLEETYAANYYNQIVKAITPEQTNPAEWTISSTKAFVGGDCVETTDSSNWDKWIKWVNCSNIVVISATSSTDDCKIISNLGPTNDREKTYLINYSGAATNAELEAAMEAKFTQWPTEPNTISPASFVVSYSQVDGVDTAFYSSVSETKSRYRYRIPEGTNTYMRYVVEETFTPADHDTENPEVSPIVVVEKTLTWSGGITVDEVFIPATPGNDDTWATEWETLETSEPGTKTHALIKYKCYTGGPWVYL